jgi:hypothetical protein
MYIIDIGTHEKSVTNDVENVLKHLSQYLNLGTRRLIYRDSQGNNDEILHENAIFKGFKPGHKGIELFEIIQNRKK